MVLQKGDDKCVMASTVSYMRPVESTTHNSNVISPALTARQGFTFSPFGNFSSSAVDQSALNLRAGAAELHGNPNVHTAVPGPRAAHVA